MSNTMGTEAIQMLLGAATGIAYHVSEMVPLHRRYPPTGAVMAEVACIRVGDRLVFHPQRLAELRAAIANPRPTSADIGRWTDDGGRA